MNDWEAAAKAYEPHIKAIADAEEALNKALADAGRAMLNASIVTGEAVGVNGWPRSFVKVSLNRVIPLR